MTNTVLLLSHAGAPLSSILLIVLVSLEPFQPSYIDSGTPTSFTHSVTAILAKLSYFSMLLGTILMVYLHNLLGVMPQFFKYCIPWTVQFSSVTQWCLTPCNPMDCSMPGFPLHHQLLELTQTHVHWAGDAIQPSHPLSSPSPPAFHLSQYQGPFQWVSCLHQVASVLELQLQHQSFQGIFRTDFL